MQKQLEQYFGCKVKIAEYKNKLQLSIFMTMRDIMMVEIYGVNFAIIDVVKEMEGYTAWVSFCDWKIYLPHPIEISVILE